MYELYLLKFVTIYISHNITVYKKLSGDFYFFSYNIYTNDLKMSKIKFVIKIQMSYKNEPLIKKSQSRTLHKKILYSSRSVFITYIQ